MALCTAVVFALQVAMAPLPNIELVSLFMILYSLYFGRKTLLIIYVFALLEGLVYGFGIWWVMYLYVWTILWLLVRLLRGKGRSAMFWAIVAAGFGLCYGFLCSLPYLALGGIPMAFAWWIAGIPFDIIHCASNFFIVLTLFAPMDRLFSTLKARGILPR